MSAPPRRYPVWDNHFHMDPTGRGVEAVKEFERAGGTHMMLVHKPYGLSRTLDDHARAFETTLALAERAREQTGVVVFVALAPHPAEFTELLKVGVPIEEAARVYREASELAARHVREGRAVAMGEVGRPHWSPVPPDVWEEANRLMEHQFALARDAGCAAIIHCETGTPEVYADLARRCDAAGLARAKAVKHYSPPVVRESDNHGLFPSVLIGKGSAEAAAAEGTRWMMETDYMDDPKYPGAVLGPKTVPRRTAELVAKGQLTEEMAWAVHAANPKRVYGVDVAL